MIYLVLVLIRHLKHLRSCTIIVSVEDRAQLDRLWLADRSLFGGTHLSPRVTTLIGISILRYLQASGHVLVTLRLLVSLESILGLGSRHLLLSLCLIIHCQEVLPSCFLFFLRLLWFRCLLGLCRDRNGCEHFRCLSEVVLEAEDLLE